MTLSDIGRRLFVDAVSEMHHSTPWRAAYEALEPLPKVPITADPGWDPYPWGVDYSAIEKRLHDHYADASLCGLALPLFPVLPRMSSCEPVYRWNPIPKPKDQTVETKHKIEIELTERELSWATRSSTPLVAIAAKAKLTELRREREETVRKAVAAEQRAKDLERIVSRRADRSHTGHSVELQYGAQRYFDTAVEADMFANMGEMFRLLRRVSTMNGDRIVDDVRTLVRKIETGE
jgi:hypothetical protein